MSENQNGEVTTEVQELQREKTTHDFVTGLKEREELKAKLYEKEREVNTLKGQNYDLMKKIESFEKQIAELNEQKPKRPTSSRDRRKTLGEKDKPKHKRPAARKKGGKGKDALSPKEAENATHHDDPFQDPEKLYAEIAGRYPDMPLSQVLQAEKKFVEADTNRDGTIDAEEMEKMLDSTSGMMFTKAEVKDMFKKIDLDNTNSIDFMELLSILDLLRQNRKTGLPTSIQNNKSQVCSIQ